MIGRNSYICLIFSVSLFHSGVVVAFPSGSKLEKIVEARENITLPCDINSNISSGQLAHVTWRLKLDGSDTSFIATQDCQSGPCEHNSTGKRFHLDLDTNGRTAKLVISNVQESDLGNYVCFFATRDGIEVDEVALRIKPPVDISCTGCTIESSHVLTVEADNMAEVWCSTEDEFNANISLNDSGLSNIHEKNSSMVRFIPTVEDNGKRIECTVVSKERNHRNITLHVIEAKEEHEATTSMENIPVAPRRSITTIARHSKRSSQRVCFYAGVFVDDQFLKSATCYEPNEVLVLPNDMHNDIGIISCTGDDDDDCTPPIKVKYADDGDDKFTMATYLSISLYVVIGMAFLVIIIVLLWRKKKAIGVRVEVNYTEPSSLSVPLTHPRPPPSSPVDSERSSTSTSVVYTSSIYPTSTIAEEELEELSSSWSDDVSTGKRQSLSRRLSARARRSLRDSTVFYHNVPIVTIMDRVKTIGWSYF